MKSAVLIAADWPGDEVVLVIEDEAQKAALVRVAGPNVKLAFVRDRLAAFMGREAFRELRALTVAKYDAAREAGAHEPAVTALRRVLDTLARELAAVRDDDRSGDPLPGTPLHGAMAEDLAEAGR
jgi:hypothetical protein